MYTSWHTLKEIMVCLMADDIKSRQSDNAILKSLHGIHCLTSQPKAAKSKWGFVFHYRPAKDHKTKVHCCNIKQPLSYRCALVMHCRAAGLSRWEQTVEKQTLSKYKHTLSSDWGTISGCVRYWDIKKCCTLNNSLINYYFWHVHGSCVKFRVHSICSFFLPSLNNLFYS